MFITILDLETTGLDPTTAQAAEIAAILFDTKTAEILQQVSTLLPITENPAEHINGIRAEVTQKVTTHYYGVQIIEQMIDCSYCLTAFNSEFDKSFADKLIPGVSASPWFDSTLLPWQHHKAQPSLVELCLHYGVPVVNAHRALDDCRLLAALMDKFPSIDDAIAHALKPRVVVKAMVGYENRHLAKEAGFIWDRLVKGAWAKRVVQGEALNVPFEIEDVE